MICSVLLILLLVSCGVSQPYDEINTDVVASLNGEFIYRDDLIKAAESYSTTDTDLYNTVLDDLISEKLEFQQAEALGLSQLTQEELAEVEASVAQEISDRYQYYYEQIRENYPDADQKSLESYTQNAVAAYVAESGETEDALIRRYGEFRILEKLYIHVTAEVSVTEDELRSRYGEYVEQDRQTYTEHPEYFESDKTTNAVYYNLPGYRYVKHIRLSTLDAAEEVLTRAQTEDFDTLMAETTEDRSSLDYPYGFAVGENSDLYIDGFADAALALESPGDLSDVIHLKDGFYIIKYVRAIPAGSEDYDEMRPYLENDLLSEKQAACYADALAEWREKAEIDIFHDILNSISDETAK